MKKFLLTATLTTCVFAAGLFTGAWMQRTQPVPAPPIGLLAEIRDVPIAGNVAPTPAPAATSQDMPRIKAEIDRIKPEVEEFKKKLDPIKKDFKIQLEALLTPEQKQRMASLHEKSAAAAKEAPKKTSNKDGMESLFPIVMVPSTLDRIASDLCLSGDQREVVHALLLKRRAQFLDLVDASPPPSLKLSKIAPLVPQAAKPEEK